jgi:pimeloyl-ACP methyl ester carboxylesterase
VDLVDPVARDILPLDAVALDAPPPDPDAEPSGFMVAADDGTRIHFLDWGEPDGGPPGATGVLLVHGVARTAWSWAPVARRLVGVAHVVAPDLRGHGLSDAPQDGYDLATLAADALAAAEGAGLLDPAEGAPSLVVAGHGFGAAVAAACAARLGGRCAGLVLVDGGWDDTDLRDGTTLDEWLRSVEEPPEVLASMAAYLADREGYDPASWDADQERAARAAVVELPARRVVSSARKHAVAAIGGTLLVHDPAVALAAVTAPIVALIARDDADGRRTEALVRTGRRSSPPAIHRCATGVSRRTDTTSRATDRARSRPRSSRSPATPDRPPGTGGDRAAGASRAYHRADG